MDVQPTFATETQASELVQPNDGAFDRPADLAQAAAVLGASFRDVRRGADLSQRRAVGFRVVGIETGIETGTLRLSCIPPAFGACLALAPSGLIRYILRDANLSITTDGDAGRA